MGSGRRSARSWEAICSRASRSTTARRPRRSPPQWIDTWLSPEFRGWNVEEDLRRIRCPVLVLQGELDEYGTEAQVQAIARGVSGRARTLLLPGLRHTPHREAPEVVLGAVAELLAE